MLQELKEKLPNPKSKWAASLTCGLTPLAFSLPEFLRPLVFPSASDAEIRLYQIIAGATFVIIGIAITIYFVRSHKPDKPFWEEVS